MCYLKYIFVIILIPLIFSTAALAGDVNIARSERVGTVKDAKASWYAIVKIDGAKKKLCIKGDIFYSKSNPNRCFRIDEIKKDTLILKESDSRKIFTLRPGDAVPLKDARIVFEKTIETEVIEYRYNISDDVKKEYMEDFTIRNLEREKVVLEKDYSKRSLLDALSEEERGVFEAPKASEDEAGAETIKAEHFEDIKIKKVGEDVWSLDRESTEAALSNIGKTLVSVIKSTEPRFRFGEGPSLRFNCQLGDIVLNRDGFLIQNLAVAALVERAGIRQGDLIKTINGQPVNSLYGVFKAYMDVKNRDAKVVNVDIVREGKRMTLVYNIK